MMPFIRIPYYLKALIGANMASVASRTGHFKLHYPHFRSPEFLTGA
jgi:hypothetical protein